MTSVSGDRRLLQERHELHQRRGRRRERVDRLVRRVAKVGIERGARLGAIVLQRDSTRVGQERGPELTTAALEAFEAGGAVTAGTERRR